MQFHHRETLLYVHPSTPPRNPFVDALCPLSKPKLHIVTVVVHREIDHLSSRFHSHDAMYPLLAPAAYTPLSVYRRVVLLASLDINHSGSSGITHTDPVEPPVWL